MSAEDTARQVIAKVGLWWPDADEGKLRSAADAWDQMASAVDAAAATGSGAAGQVTGSNSGKAVEAFSAFWKKYDGGGESYLPATAAACRGMADGLRQYADAVEQAKHKVEELAVTIGATLVVGTALAFFTFGISEAAAASVTAELITAAAAIGIELSGTIASIIAATMVGAAFGAVEGFALDVAVAQPIRVAAFHDGGFSWDEAKDWAIGGAATGGLLGAGGAAVRSMTRFGRPPYVWTPEDGTPVLGRLPDTAVARDWDGHAVLNLKDWSIANNDRWLQSIIDKRAPIYSASPETPANLYDDVMDRPTVYGRELQMIKDAGYVKVGDYYVPPELTDSVSVHAGELTARGVGPP